MIRLLEMNELSLAYELGLKFYKEGKLAGEIKKRVFVSTWTNLILKNIGVIFGLFNNNNLTGMIGGIVFPDPNDGVPVAIEMFWYVDKKHRGAGGVNLFKVFEMWAKSVNAKRLVMVHLVNLMPDKLDRFYKNQGFFQTEIHYMKEI